MQTAGRLDAVANRGVSVGAVADHEDGEPEQTDHERED